MVAVIAAPRALERAGGIPAAGARLWDRPDRQQVRADLRDVDGSGVVAVGGLDLLHHVVEGLYRLGRVADVPVTFVGTDRDSTRLLTHVLSDSAVRVGTWDEIAAARPVELMLARNDIGGIMLCEAEFARRKFQKFGMQAYHDDVLIADGWIRSLAVRPSYDGEVTLRASVTPRWRGPIAVTYGRAVQAAGDEVPMLVDGVDYGTVTGRTWYVDDRVSWQLRGIVPLP